MKLMHRFIRVALPLLLLSSSAYAGTNTGCSGDQWSNHSSNGDIEDIRFVYRTNNLWEIGNSGDQKEGCGTVSKRSNSKTSIKMNNVICAYRFDTKTEKLTVRSMPHKHCICAGTFRLHKTCSEGEF